MPFKNLFHLLNRRGGTLPPDRVTRRDVLTTDNELLDFVLCAKRLLGILCKSTVDLEIRPKHEETFEDFVENFFEHISESNK